MSLGTARRTTLSTDTLQRQGFAYYPDGTMRDSTQAGTGRAQIFGYAVDREREAAYDDSHLLATASLPQAGVLVAIRGLDGKVRREAVESGCRQGFPEPAPAARKCPRRPLLALRRHRPVKGHPLSRTMSPRGVP